MRRMGTHTLDAGDRDLVAIIELHFSDDEAGLTPEAKTYADLLAEHLIGLYQEELASFHATTMNVLDGMTPTVDYFLAQVAAELQCMVRVSYGLLRSTRDMGDNLDVLDGWHTDEGYYSNAELHQVHA